MSVFFYISGHGFGHATRQIAIINALSSAAPELAIVVRTTAPEWLFARTCRAPVTWLEGDVDTGVVQIDSLRLDAAATIARAEAFHRTLPDRAEAEAEVLRRHGARLAVVDAPPLGCAAAAFAGIPSVVCANFTWDWIYSGYPEAALAPDLVPLLSRTYREATAGWRMPMHGGFATVAPILDLPFVARHARRDVAAADVRTELGLPLDRPLALLSFGGYGLAGPPLDRLDCLPHWGVVVTATGASSGRLPPGIVHVREPLMYERGLRYEDLVRAVDVVITKPGYGIISDCVANDTAILYTSRGRFVEYDVLVDAMPRVLRCRFIDMAALLGGRWKAALDAVASAPPPPVRPPTDGAERAAALILDRSQPWSRA